MRNAILIYGAGGHGLVVLDALLANGLSRQCLLFVDDATPLKHIDGVRVIRQTRIPEQPCAYIVAIGDNRVRHEIGEMMRDLGHFPALVVHPSATVSSTAILGNNTVVCAQANVGPYAIVGDSVIINTGATVEHECEVGDATHIAPHAVLCGGSTVGHHCLIGAGSVLLPGAVVKDRVILGAHSLVLEKMEIESERTVVGSPAKRELTE